MLDVLLDLVSRPSFWLLAPAHELGHSIAGWLTFNPAIPVAWNETAFLGRYPGFFPILAGQLGEFVFLAWLFRFLIHQATKGTKTGLFLSRLWPIVPILWISSMASIAHQEDVNFVGEAGQAIWTLAGILTLASLPAIVAIERRNEDARRRTLDQRRKPQRSLQPT